MNIQVRLLLLSFLIYSSRHSITRFNYLMSSFLIFLNSVSVIDPPSNSFWILKTASLYFIFCSACVWFNAGHLLKVSCLQIALNFLKVNWSSELFRPQFITFSSLWSNAIRWFWCLFSSWKWSLYDYSVEK